jgi:hypothetical protein
MFSPRALAVAALVVAVAVAFGWLVHHIHVTDHRDERRARWIAYARVTRARRRHVLIAPIIQRETL